MASHLDIAPVEDCQRRTCLGFTPADYDSVFRIKYMSQDKIGRAPRTRRRIGYFTPDDYYEMLVSRLITEGCSWLDVGGGRDLFPSNKILGRLLSRRCSMLVGVDPSSTLDENSYVHQRVKSTIENYRSDRRFQVVTLRMVAEHITEPESAVASIAQLVEPQGKVVVYTINKWSPASLVALLTPFSVHHPVKKLLWGTEEEDTFPIAYKMNTRTRLRSLFNRFGFKESFFAYLSDCRLFCRFPTLNLLELLLWRLSTALRCTYPENCLLGVYERAG